MLVDLQVGEMAVVNGIRSEAFQCHGRKAKDRFYRADEDGAGCLPVHQ